ncbi:hypothetical protein BDN71DRAFT_210310 [Pleurotus eryngii]|uniref:Uncharacterized protein n=1 Tax=Pleurotus eryngii TaxID=5323 RepID=A0A9P6D400_PLEER|nr:hypothetical protein BDN71DRAFT_210310 [Pleurotus eryngii]
MQYHASRSWTSGHYRPSLDELDAQFFPAMTENIHAHVSPGFDLVVVGGEGGAVEQDRVTADPLITLQLRDAASCQQACSSIETHLRLLHGDSRDAASAGAILLRQSLFHLVSSTHPRSNLLARLDFRLTPWNVAMSLPLPSTQESLELLRRTAGPLATNLKTSQPCIPAEIPVVSWSVTIIGPPALRK